jgi:hypothetical protein
LTNLEEEIFGTNPTQPDSDADGYLDGHEVLHLYNPAGIAPERLEAAGLVLRYLNEPFAYEILYPAKWQKEEGNSEGREVRFKSATGEYISLLVEDNPQELSLSQWYKQQALPGELGALKQVTTKSGLNGFLSFNGLTAFFPGEKRVYLLNYNPQSKTELNYPRIFEMMINSFRLR